jgi:hypothetical protein
MLMQAAGQRFVDLVVMRTVVAVLQVRIAGEGRLTQALTVVGVAQRVCRG